MMWGDPSKPWRFGCLGRAVAGIGALAIIPFALPQCGFPGGGDQKDVTVAPPALFVTVLKPPLLPIMHASDNVKVAHTPHSFELQAFLWEFKRHGLRIEPLLVRSWKRFKDELPRPGKVKKFLFPDLRLGGPNDKADDLLSCEAGQYFMQFHIFGYDSLGVKQNIHAFFPYDTRRGHVKYADEPSPRQSWQVRCDKTGQVPNPKGVSAPVFTIGR